MATVLNFFRSIGTTKLMAIIASIITLLLMFVIYFYIMSRGNMIVLYNDLSMEDSSAIIEKLEQIRQPYQVIGSGATIKVPEQDITRVRMFMAKEGLPSKGAIVGYEIFDKDESLGTTSFMQNVKLVRALEGELSRTIESFIQVKKARVHLVLPQKELFSRDKQLPTASIMLQLKHNAKLKKGEINAISHLVATAVPGLNSKEITIVDSKGAALKLGGEDEEDLQEGLVTNEQLRISYEKRLKHTIENLLSRSLGEGRVRAEVNVEMNFDRVVTNSETFDPDTIAIRSKQTTEDNERTPVGSSDDNTDISLDNNIPDGNSAKESNGGNFATITKNEETTNYEVSKVIQNKVTEVGSIQNISVAVLVDGKYDSSEPDLKPVYQPRSKEEMEQIENLVKTVVAYDSSRGDQIKIVNMQFTESTFNVSEEDSIIDWGKEYLPNIVQTIVFALSIILVFIYVIRPIAMKAFDKRPQTSGLSSPNMHNSTIPKNSNSENVDSPLKSESILTASEVIRNAKKNISLDTNEDTSKELASLIDKYKDSTVAVIRKWLAEK